MTTPAPKKPAVPVETKQVDAWAKIKSVVIDAGHGGNDPGAIGRSGLKEKDVNLDVAKRMAVLLRENGVSVILTRTSDRFVSLQERVNITNNSKADLFISIHSNANRVRSLNGFEVYYISSAANDTKRALQAANSARLDFDSSCFAGNSVNLRATLWDMIYTSSRAESIELARSICHSIDNDLEARVIGVKSASFYVLKGARMPAVLIEIGFVSNGNEERLLKDSSYRQKLAESITGGIRDYATQLSLTEVAKQ